MREMFSKSYLRLILSRHRDCPGDPALKLADRFVLGVGPLRLALRAQARPPSSRSEQEIRERSQAAAVAVHRERASHRHDPFAQVGTPEADCERSTIRCDAPLDLFREPISAEMNQGVEIRAAIRPQFVSLGHGEW